MAISESYPDLKANTNFIDLQRQLKDMEGEIANARKYYNGVVKAFNTRTETIPSNLIAGICGFKKMPLFVVKDEAQRENVKVSFWKYRSLRYFFHQKCNDKSYVCALGIEIKE